MTSKLLGLPQVYPWHLNSDGKLYIDRFALIFMEIFFKNKNWEIIFEIKVIFCIYMNVFYSSPENA